MGRRKLADKYSLTPQVLAQAMNKSRTMVGAARSLGISVRALYYYRKQYALPKRERFVPTGHYGCVAAWVKAHPSAVFPRWTKAIAKLTGCSKDSVATYLYRRRKQELAKLHALPDLRLHYILVTTTQRKRVPTAWFRKYDVFVDHWSFKLKITATLKNDIKVKVFTTADALRKLLDEEVSSS